MAAEKKLRILVVSDDPLLREEVRYGYSEDEVSLATDSRDALARVEEGLPDVVVVDLQTGSAGGFNLIRSLRQHKKTREIPVLLLLERPQDEWLARQAGATATRVKPLEVSDLVFETLALVSSAERS